jgi:heptosyltransferase I
MSDRTSAAPGRICLIRLSSIGDVCHAVSMVQAIQRHFPGCPITWVIGRAEAELVHGLPGVEFLICDKSQGLAGMARLRKELKLRRFDVLLHMQISLRASLVSLMVRSPRRIGFDRARAGEGQWLFTNERIRRQERAHVLDGFAAFAAELGVPDHEPRWEIPISREERDWATTVLPDGRPVLGIVPAASRPERNWTAEGYAALASHAMARHFRVALFGGPSPAETRLGEEIRSCLGQPVSNLIGRTTLKQLLALLGRTAVLVAPDTGPAHMAVTQGIPVIGLYCHSNPRRTGPYTSMDYVVNHYDRLFQERYGVPWTERPWGTRLTGEKLMESIRVEEVTGMFDRVVAERRLAE